MNTTYLTQSTRLVLSNLESLRHEHNLLLSSSNMDEDKNLIVKKSNESIDLGINEGYIMLELENYIENFNNETYILMLQVERLKQENNWLRDELSLTEKHLQTSTQLQQDYQHDIHLLNESLNALNIIKSTSSTNIDTEKEISTDQKTSSSSSSDIPPRFRTLHNLVIQYAQAGRYEVAVPLCRQALEDLEKTHGHTHPDVATMLNILALVYRDQNKFQDALELLTEALDIREKTLGSDHPAVAATLNNLAVLYGKKNRYKEAEPLCKRALEIREKYFGINHPDVGKQLNNLALLCLNQGKYDQVEEYYKRAIDIYKNSYGINDINLLKTKNNLASAYLREGKIKLALEIYQQILSQVISNQQNSNRDMTIIGTIFKNLGAICRRQDHCDQADYLESSENHLEMIKKALNIIQQLQSNHETSCETIRRCQDYGKLRRSGSFQKLRQSIRRGSEKLVQKLRGTTSSSSCHSIQSNGLTKRASSMSVLNQIPPSKQQYINHTLKNPYSIDHQQHNKQTFILPSRGRLISAENLR